MASFRIGVDIGGTFTDLIFFGNSGAVHALKVPSTPHDFGEAVLTGIRQGMKEYSIAPDDIMRISHGFTVATNAILEGKGARVALVTTGGFRDVLEFRRNRMPKLYDFHYQKPDELVPRDLRFEVNERLNFKGEVLEKLDEAQLRLIAARIREMDVDSVAICFLHSYANSAHEDRAGEILSKLLPDISITKSSTIIPIINEYERTSTTVVNCYVRPVVETYLKRLDDGIKALGIRANLMIMQSNGGLSSMKTAGERPVSCIESGPAAGVLAGSVLIAREANESSLTFDMGGTTAKASIIENGELLRSQECEVGAGINAGHRLLRGAGHVIKVPAIDIAEVGAGGGSIARVADGRVLSVGPASAGSIPGPACYGKGGTEPTVTDANVVLGYLNPDHLLGGGFKLDPNAARRAVAEQIAAPLDMAVEDAAYGIHMIANSSMSRALKAVSSERGRDPRKFQMVAFGGGGPIHGAGLASLLGIRRVIIPQNPGVFSAVGLAVGNIEYQFVQTLFKSFESLDLGEVNAIIERLKAECLASLPEGADIRFEADVKYSGQASEIAVPITEFPIVSSTLDRMAEAFDEEHEKTYSYRAEAGYQILNLRVIGRQLDDWVVPRRRSSPVARKSADRRAFFGPRHGWATVPLLNRSELTLERIDGPLIVEEYDSTTIVPPLWSVAADENANIVLTVSDIIQ